MEGPARMLRKPFAYLGMLVSGVVVDDRMDRLSLGNVRVDVSRVGAVLAALDMTALRCGAGNLDRGQRWSDGSAC